ncbi:unnamed protein product [Prorocentrum cordatum]|uniref:CBS domain-containing protein n=1 Tax=Prorocentrum cordatum TaxID=2364126 RepID=A0ABN9VYI6_9DINO|nr:unnamed protein product [Polarella glacialis]
MSDSRFQGSGAYACGLDEVVFLPSGPCAHDGAVDLRSRLSRNVPLGLPVVGGLSEAASSPDVAVALSLQGGVGVIHRNQPVQAQADMVRRVKGHESGFIMDPRTFSGRCTVAEAAAMRAECGIGTFPVTESGRMGSRLLGLVTARDLEACADGGATLADIMTREVTCVTEPTTLREATAAMVGAKVGKLPIVNGDRELQALICQGDLRRNALHPLASRDANRHLLVAAAVAAGEPGGLERASALVDAGADVLLLDTDGGVDGETVTFLGRLKQAFAGVDVVAGRVSSGAQAARLLAAGAEGLRVGGGGAGADAALLHEVARLAHAAGVPVLADCGARGAGDALKALCLGAAAVAIDGPLGGAEPRSAWATAPAGRAARPPAGAERARRGSLRAGAGAGARARGPGGAASDKGSVADLAPGP